MQKKFLYIDKRQRIDIKGEYPKKVARMMDEFKAHGYDYDFAYIDTVEILFSKGTTQIKAGGKDITEYTHILLGGHSLNDLREYELKYLIVDLIDKYNQNQPEEKKIKVQNSKFIKKLPHYSKISMAKLCLDNDIPHLNTYYKADGSYKNENNPFDYPIITKHYTGKNDLVMIDGTEKVKKTVFKVDNLDEWNQERLDKKNLKNYIIQEFTDVGEDIRTFVSKGKVIGGWRRVAGASFLTVTKGSTYIYYNQPSSDIIEICEKAAEAWEVDFMALDFIYKDNKPYVLEYSMHPGFSAYETKCIEGEPVNIAEAIINSF